MLHFIIVFLVLKCFNSKYEREFSFKEILEFQKGGIFSTDLLKGFTDRFLTINNYSNDTSLTETTYFVVWCNAGCGVAVLSCGRAGTAGPITWLDTSPTIDWVSGPSCRVPAHHFWYTTHERKQLHCQGCRKWITAQHQPEHCVEWRHRAGCSFGTRKVTLWKIFNQFDCLYRSG